MIKIYGRLAIIALLVFAGVSLWYGRVEKRLQTKSPIAKNETAIPPVQKAAESETVKTDYQIILTRNIFKAALEGDGQPSGEQQPAEAEDLAETKMQLVLLGTVAGSKEDARAVIRNEKTKVEDIYHVGSELYGASITRIGRGKVVLQVNGREEVLNIKETESRGGPQQTASPADTPQPQAQSGGEGERPAPVVVPQRRISFRNSTSSAPAPAAPAPAATAPADTGAPSSAEEPAKQGDGQPVPAVPGEETPVSGNGADENAGQQSQ